MAMRMAPRQRAFHNPADGRVPGRPMAIRAVRPSSAGASAKRTRRESSGWPDARPAATSPHNRRHVCIPASRGAGRAPGAAAPEAEIARAARRAAARCATIASAPSAWPRSRATRCSSRSICWSPTRICAASSACSSSGWWTTRRRTPAASGCSTRRPAPATCGWRTSGARRSPPESAGWASLDLPRESMSRHLRGHARRRAPASSSTTATTRGCPSRCAPSIAPRGVNVLLVAPLRLPPRTLGWVALSSVRGLRVRAALAARAARRHGAAGDAGALLQPAGRAEPARGAAPGGARRAQPHRPRHPRHAGPGVRRHPDAAAGGAARRRVEPAAGGGAQPRDRGRSRAHAPDRGAPLGGGAAAASTEREDVADGAAAAWSIWRSAPATCRSSSSIDELPAFDAGVEREIIGIAQEALTNAVAPRPRPPHRRARRRACAASASGCRWPTMAAASPAIAAPPGSA